MPYRYHVRDNLHLPMAMDMDMHPSKAVNERASLVHTILF